MSQSSRDLERVLRRSDINRGQITLLKYLYEPSDEYVSKKEIIDEIRWGDHDSFDGVLAAFSTRINNTEGISGKPGYTAFIERRNIDGKEHFRLRKQARKAIARIPELLDVFEKPMDELLEGVRLEIEDFSLSETSIEDYESLEYGWSTSSLEDRLLVGYWQDVGGTIITEVQTGSSGPSLWPEGSKPRQIDGIRIRSEYRDEICPQKIFTKDQICDIVDKTHVEIIEVKESLNRPVIGQAIAGRDLFRKDYSPVTIEPVVVCKEEDPALEWVCRKNGVRVEIVEPKTWD